MQVPPLQSSARPGHERTQSALVVQRIVPKRQPSRSSPPSPPPAPPSVVPPPPQDAPDCAKHTPPEPHWYLNMLATHPDWQRQGLGGALMGTVFETADAMGLPCYLETVTDVNVAYYRHHGFEVRSEWDLRAGDDVGPPMWGMLRPVR